MNVHEISFKLCFMQVEDFIFFTFKLIYCIRVGLLDIRSTLLMPTFILIEDEYSQGRDTIIFLKLESQDKKKKF